MQPVLQHKWNNCGITCFLCVFLAEQSSKTLLLTRKPCLDKFALPGQCFFFRANKYHNKSPKLLHVHRSTHPYDLSVC